MQFRRSTTQGESMRLKTVYLACAVVLAAACEHPFANAAQPGAPPVELAAALAVDAEDVVLASATLQALLRQHAEAPAAGGLDSPGRGTGPAARPAPASWLETQSAALRVLVRRSRSAHEANAPSGR